MLPRLDQEALALCDVLIVPQTERCRFFNSSVDDIRDFVKKGGGVMLTHDAVGYRWHRTVFPEVGRGISHPKLGVAVVVEPHPVTEGFNTGDPLAYAYSYDHVAIAPGTDGQILMKDKETTPPWWWEASARVRSCSTACAQEKPSRKDSLHHQCPRNRKARNGSSCSTRSSGWRQNNETPEGYPRR